MFWREIKGFQKGQVSTELVAIGREADGVTRNAYNVRTKSGSVVSKAGSELYINFDHIPQLNGGNIGYPYEYRRENYSGGATTIWRAIVFNANNKLWYVQPEVSLTIAVNITGHPTVAGKSFRYVNIYDHLWLLNGDVVYVWDGISIKKAGITAPTKTAPVLTVNSAGTMSVRYKFTYYADNAPYVLESNATGYAEATMAKDDPPSITVNYSKPGGEVTDSQVTDVRIYRTAFWDPATESPNSTYYFVEDKTIAEAIADGWVYTDTLTDYWLMQRAEYDDTDRSLPPHCFLGLWHDNRLFLAQDLENPSVVYYSQAGKPFYFPATNYDEVNRDDGDVITALGSIGPTRYIFKNRSIHEWTGNPETATPIRQVERLDATQNMNRVPVGCAYAQTLVGWNNSLIFRTENGDVYMLTQESLRNLTEFYNEVRTLTSSCAAFVKDDYYVIGDSYKSYVCYLPTGAWESNDTNHFNYALVRYNNDVLVPTRWADPEDDSIIYCGFNRLYVDGLTTDYGAAVTKIFQTKYIKLIDGDDEQAVIRRVRVSCTNELAFAVAVYNELGQASFGLYDVTTKSFSIPASMRLRGKYVSVGLTWYGDTEIFGLSVGFLKRGKH